MKELAILLRAMNLFAHSAHTLVARTPFHSDHEFFGVYSELDDDYDAIVGRMIGLFGEEPAELGSIVAGAAQKLAGSPSIGVKENSIFYVKQLQFEKELCSLISKVIAAGVSPGTEQTLGTICEKSEIRQYKCQQRIKKWTY